MHCSSLPGSDSGPPSLQRRVSPHHAAAIVSAAGVGNDAACARRWLVETLTKKNKTSKVKPFMVKNYLSVFVNATVENPTFDSQVRSCLRKQASQVSMPNAHRPCLPPSHHDHELLLLPPELNTCSAS